MAVLLDTSVLIAAEVRRALDLAIAATANVHGVPLLTRNAKRLRGAKMVEISNDRDEALDFPIVRVQKLELVSKHSA